MTGAQRAASRGLAGAAAAAGMPAEAAAALLERLEHCAGRPGWALLARPLLLHLEPAERETLSPLLAPRLGATRQVDTPR